MYGYVSIKTAGNAGMLAIMINYYKCTFLKIIPPKNLEIRQFIRIFAVAFGKMHYQNCSLLEKIKQNYLSADKVVFDFLQEKPKISLTELRRLIIKVLMNL